MKSNLSDLLFTAGDWCLYLTGKVIRRSEPDASWTEQIRDRLDTLTEATERYKIVSTLLAELSEGSLED